MPQSRSMQISGWGNVTREPAEIYRPERVSEAHALVSQAPQNSLIARGLGRSYGDAALNAGGAVLLDIRLNRFASFDPSTAILDCEGGASLQEIINTFLPRGFFPPVTPGTQYVTVGGAIAADVHGKNHHRDGSLGEFVQSLDLLTAGGEILRCARDLEPELFWATLGGMGLTGIILSARILLRPVESAYIAVEYQKAGNLDQTLAAFADADSRFQYSVAWIDCLAVDESLGRSVLIRGNHALAAALPSDLRERPLEARARRKKSVPFHFPGFALSPLTVRMFNASFYSRHEEGQKLVDYDEFFYPLDSILHWNRIYGKRGFFQYQAVFPQPTAAACLRELLKRLSASRRASFLAVLKTMGKPSGGMLSFPMPGQTLALDLPNTGPDTVQFLRELDAVVLHHGGRVYLAKDACLTPESFRAMYPRLGEFESVKARIDPHNRFSSSLSRRLEIGGRT